MFWLAIFVAIINTLEAIYLAYNGGEPWAAIFIALVMIWAAYMNAPNKSGDES